MKQILIRAFSVVLAAVSVNAASAQNGKMKKDDDHRIYRQKVITVPATTTTVNGTTTTTIIHPRTYPRHPRKYKHDNGLHKGWYKKGRHHGNQNEQ